MYIKIILSYDGSRYNGSQKQPKKNTIQDELEIAFRRLSITSKLAFSGRTDKNVHASGQVISCEIPDFWTDLEKLKTALSKQIPNSIHIKKIIKAKDNFHARFSAKKRIYRYIISAKPITAFNDKYLHYHKNINIDKIQEAAKYFIGIHDFEYFSKSGSEPKSTIREIYDIKFYKYKDFYIFKFKANSYLRSQIRMIVSFLLKISDGKVSIDDLKNQLQKKELISWTLAPANGLYLSRIIY
ncbi:MAG: tRNA pseudouridine(38-40) synthase TruA [Arcobacteraceae bacterium]|nr:tRNA pseudouridine(38-40) synthase TruA [Arcobacteraceae bacterium]